METEPVVQRLDSERQKLADALPAYEIGPALGRGAFAVVYLGRHRHLEREVAIKRLTPDMLREGHARERFAAEARLLASLDHPHIVRVHDFVDDGDVCAFVMERMRGGTLHERLARGAPSHAWACAVMLGALYGLEAAHRQGVLHRDIKPDNLLFGDGELVKVADFGIAKVLGAKAVRYTATAAAIGTPRFMAPEQVSRSAGELSSATDVWSAGAVLYEMLAGAPPFSPSGEIGDIFLQRVTEDPRPLGEAAPDVPDELAAVVMHALVRDPTGRYPTAAAFAAALEPAAERALGHGALASTGVPIHRSLPQSGETSGRTLVEPSEVDLVPARPPRSGRRRWLLGAIGGAAVAAAALAVVLLLGSDRGGGGGGGGATRTASAVLPGWPKTLSVGFVDQVGGVGGVFKRLGAGGNTYNVYYGDAAAGKDWSKDPEQQPPADFVRTARRAGLFPYLGFYSLRVLGRTGRGGDAEGPELRATLANRRLMGIYWNNVRKFLKTLGSTRAPAAVSLDSNFWSTLEQHLAYRGERPTTVRARVGLSGLSELKGIPDNLIGIAQGWRALRDRYAPKVLLGYAFDDWAAAGVDISRDGPPRQTVIDSARQAGEFYLDVAANQLDFAALTINGDGAQEGQNSSRQNVYSPAEKDRVVDFVGEFSRVAGIPVVLEGVPLGNTVSKSISDKPFHWRDSWVQWLIGDNRFSGLRRMHDAGVIGVLFGVSYAEGETCPCDAAHDGVTNNGKYPQRATSPDDDGGYFAERMAALRRAGGLALR